MMMLAEEYLCGSGRSLPTAAAGAGCRWWPLLQWLGVSLAHAALFATMLQLPVPERPAPAQVLQVSLITPESTSASTQPTSASPPAASPEPPRPTPPEPPRPTPPEPPPPTPPQPAVEQVAPAPRKPPVRRSPMPEKRRTPSPSALTTPRPEPAAPPAAPTALATEQEPAASPAVPASSGGAAVAAAGPGMPAALVPPLFHADYLDNPAPPYPSTSRRRGESGRVLLRVFVSADGKAERVEINTSSGFELLDAAAREAVARWRFVPARRGPEKVAAWVIVPISFVM